MSYTSMIKRILLGSTPTAGRGTAGPYITCAPINAALKQLVDHATAGISKWGNMIELLAATANTSECWIEALVVELATAAGLFNIGLTMATGAGIFVAANSEVVVPAYGLAAAPTIYKLSPTPYIPAGQRIAAAAAGVAAKKVSVGVILSRRK